MAAEEDEGWQVVSKRKPAKKSLTQKPPSLVEIKGFYLSCSCEKGPSCARKHPAFSHVSQWDFSFYGTRSETREQVELDVRIDPDGAWLRETTSFRPARVIAGDQVPIVDEDELHESKIQANFFDRWNEIIDNIPIETKQHCIPGQVLKRREGGDNLCEKFSNLSKVIFIAGPWIEQIDKEKDPEERRKWLLLDYNNINLIFHLPHEEAKQALEKVEELYTISSFNLHKFKITY